MRPSNGARMVFFAMVARRFATVALDCLAFASAASRSACVGLAAAQPLRALQAEPRERRLGDGRGELCLLRGGVEPHEHRAAPHEAAGLERDLADGPGQLGAEDDASLRHERPDRLRRRLPLGGLDLGGGDGLRGRHEGLPRLHHADDLIGLHAHEDADDDDETDDDDDPLPGPALHERPRMKSGYATADAGPGDRAQERRDRAVPARLAAAPR